MNGEEYTLTGITLYNIFWLSYDTDSTEHDLFYLYDANTYDAFSEEILLMKKEEDAAYINEVDSIIIITEDNSEGGVLDQLMTEYPAENYYSSVYDAVWVRAYNRPILIRLTIMNMILVLTMGTFWYLIRKKSFTDEACKLDDYRNYYICDYQMTRIYICSSMLISAGTLLIEWVFFFFACGTYYKACAGLMGMDVLIMLFIQFISIYVNTHTWRKKR